MRKLNKIKTKNQVIVVPTTAKTKSTHSPAQLAKKTRPIHSKTNTLAYYNCLIDQIANPTNQKTKITQLTKHCKCSKEEVAKTQQEHKQQLVQQLAQSYKSFGESLGHYLHADIIGCAKELKQVKK